jgi:transposase
VPKVDEDLLQALAKLIEGQPTAHGIHRSTWTREALAIALTTKAKVRVSVSTLARMLRRLGARWGRPRPIVICHWSKRRKAQRVAALQRLLANLPPNEVAYYEDEVDIHLNPRIGPDWMLRCQQKLVVTPGKNRKCYLAGALASDESDLVFVSSDKKNSRLFIALLQQLLEKHIAGKAIHLVLDNFSIHDSKRVQKFIAATHGKIQLHFLPPYSPEHNKIERLWQRLHANVTRNHACPDMDGLMRNARRYLRSYAQKLRRESRVPSAA